MPENKIKQEKAFLIGLTIDKISKIEINEQLIELEMLANTAGASILGKFIQNRYAPDPATFIGKGIIEKIRRQAEELDCNLIIFNDDISPSQIKNLQKVFGKNIKVIDRTGLILDIFTKHAKTKEAKTQVELAQLEYFLPRLTRHWTHLERQMGGIGTRAGAGETQIEVDRRLIRNKISKLKDELLKIQKQRDTQSYNRFNTYRIALVGYTNAGKSTLMNALTNSDVLVENKLFATLDTTTRKLKLNSNLSILLSDTVGFIRKLPHSLVASFRSTLDEVKQVNMLIKVFDASSDSINDHINTVEETLSEMNLSNKTSLIVMNKIDAIKNKDVLEGLKNRFNNAIFVSSLNLINIDTLIKHIKKIISSNYINYKFKLSHEQAKLLDYIYKNTNIISKLNDYSGTVIEGKASQASIDKIKSLIDGK